MKYFTRSEWMILAGLFVLSFIPVSAGIFRLVELGGEAVPNSVETFDGGSVHQLSHL